PRGAHVLSSALVRLRRATGIETLVPLHRLDRRTAGVLAFGIRPEERPAYQQLFARREVDKRYEALVLPEPSSSLPRRPGERRVLRDRLDKRRGELTTRVLTGEPNAVTALEVLARGAAGAVRMGLRPPTGPTHQPRAPLPARGAPRLGEDLYPPPHPAVPPARCGWVCGRAPAARTSCGRSSPPAGRRSWGRTCTGPRTGRGRPPRCGRRTSRSSCWHGGCPSSIRSPVSTGSSAARRS